MRKYGEFHFGKNSCVLFYPWGGGRGEGGASCVACVQVLSLNLCLYCIRRVCACGVYDDLWRGMGMLEVRSPGKVVNGVSLETAPYEGAPCRYMLIHQHSLGGHRTNEQL